MDGPLENGDETGKGRGYLKRSLERSQKRFAKKKIHEKCEAELKERMSTYSKLKDGPVMTESFKMRDYMREMTVVDARVKFALRSEMYDVSFN